MLHEDACILQSLLLKFENHGSELEIEYEA
jgi:hypothetical protein